MSSIRRVLGVTAVLAIAISAPLSAQGVGTGLATEVGGFPRGAPGTGGSPIAFGANWGDIYAGAVWQVPTRYSYGSDAGAGIGFGLADAHDIIGIELNVVPLTTVQAGATNHVQFAAKIHKLLADNWGIAVGVQNIYLTNKVNNATFYGVVSKVIDLKGTAFSMLESVSLSAGAGNESFRLEKDSIANDYTVAAFGSAAFRFSKAVSVIIDWPGQDLNAGIMIAPIPSLPIVITPSIVDITGTAGTHNFGTQLARPRFALSTGFVLKF